MSQEVVLGGDSMKTINSLLAHIDKITQSAKTGTSHDKAAKAKMLKATQDDDAAVCCLCFASWTP